MRAKVGMRSCKNGYWHFFYKGKDVTHDWVCFFATLSIEQEKDCERLFIKWYEKRYHCLRDEPITLLKLRGVIKENGHGPLDALKAAKRP